MFLSKFGSRVWAASWPLSRLRRPEGLVMALLLALAHPCPAAEVSTGPSVKEVIEFTRIVQPQNHDAEALRSQVSPDGRRAFIVTRQADVASDQNRFEIRLLDVDPAHLAALHRAGRGGAPKRLLSIVTDQDHDDADPFLQDARWVGNRVIAFRGRLRGQAFQAYAVDVATRRLRPLTAEPQGVVSFDVSADLRRVVYVAPVPNPPMPAGAHSVVVGNHSFWSVKFGQNDLRAQQRRYQYWVAQVGTRTPARPLGEAFAESSGRYPRVSISPNGQWALLPRYEPDRQLAWGRQYPMVADITARFSPALTQDPLSYYSRPYSYVVRRMVAYRLQDGREQTVVEAPDDSLPGTGQLRNDRLWRDDGSSVVIAGTFLPPEADDTGSPPTGSHIIEYWPDSGRWTRIAALNGRLVAAYRVAGQADAFVAIDAGKRRQFVRQPGGGWREEPTASASAGAGGPGAAAATAWTLKVGEALNQPPDIVATGPQGQEVKLTDLNPQFSPARWGVIRPYAWKDAKGRSWDGGLLVPHGLDASSRHALVIQTYGFSASRFYLDGSNLYTGYTSGFAGRAFLRVGVLVLAFPWAASSDAPSDEHGANRAFMDGVRGAVDALVADGLVDRDRVGIMGWSATGERVLNLLTFSDAPIRAATILDGDANTLFSMTITYAVKDGIQGRKETTNQGPPFGEALQRWTRNDPSLHTDCVRAALRIESYGPLVQNNWDVYALLRRQYKPAEMVVIPEGAHALSRPSERMISLQGNVDWFRFWLKDEARTQITIPGETEAALKDQYTRWRQMADLKRADDARPRCAALASMEGGG